MRANVTRAVCWSEGLLFVAKNMEYHFYLGESEERERLISGSGRLRGYQERVTRIYTTFREKEIEIVRSLGKWLVLGPYDGSLLEP